eukprot:Colp12_sorted_trinity150504_noHs@20398
MGNCMSSRGAAVTEASMPATPLSPTERSHGPAVGKNRRLTTAKIVWRSDEPMTQEQLLKKRQEFWDTAPAFEGKKEVWQALRAAAECSDQVIAQGILDSAGVILPTGQLSEAYDEQGVHYKVPLYCLTAPQNLLTSAPASMANLASNQGASSEQCVVNFRLSNREGKDHVWTLPGNTTFAQIAETFEKEADCIGKRLRFLYGGRMLAHESQLGSAKIPTGHVIQVVVT